ncbi:MAG TPA: FAD-dependent monooxygenase [Woeseiaceae bacterium]|nr:FAD-dependent monooxygenase [Woeseiaceae bacterium]
MRTSDTQVLIVGGGAAGSMLSLELARHGVEFRTVDRLPGPGHTSRAIAVHARTLEILERIDKRLLEPYLAHGIHNKGYVLHYVDTAGKRSEVRPGLDFTTLDCRYPYILIHGQCDSENYIRDYLRGEFGLGTEWNTQCTSVTQDADGVIATLAHTGNGDDNEIVRCQYLVACDGINSRVREALGLEQEGSDYKGTVLQNLDVFLEGFPDAEDYVHYCAGTDHFIMIVKLPGGFYRLLLSDRGEAAGPAASPAAAFKRIVDKHFDGVSLGESVWHSKWESWVRLAKNYREGRVFLAGDSAHVHSTTGGQGMNCCMQDASNLGWKLGFVLRGLARPELLDSYVDERRPIAEQVIWAASSLHEIFMGHGKDIKERAARMNDPLFLEQVVGRCSGISYTYRDYVRPIEGLSVQPGPAIGDRAPDADLGGGRSLYDLTRHTGFTLFVLRGATADKGDGNRSLARLQKRYGQVMQTHELRSSPAVERDYGNSPYDRVFLVRPDGYVGFRGALTELSLLETRLSSMLTL